MNYSYDIRPSAQNKAGGWNLHLFENGQVAGRVAFPADDPVDGDLDPVKGAFLRAQAEAALWMKGRKVYSKRRRRLIVHPGVAIALGLVVLIAVFNIFKYAI
jgi:hypothetical protein